MVTRFKGIAFCIVLFCLFISLPCTAMATPIPGLYATGVNNNGQAIGLGLPDPHYTVVETGQSAVTMSGIPGSYIPNNSSSLWIWQQANGQPTNITRTFRLQFDLTGLIPSTAQITGQWAVDNYGLDILVNGVSSGQVCYGFGGWTAFSLTSGFVAGLNTLDFVANDVGFISGFRVGGISGTADIPEPLTIALLAVSSAVVFVRRRS